MTRSRESLTRRELFTRVFRRPRVTEESNRSVGKERALGLSQYMGHPEALPADEDNTERVLREMDNPRGLADP